MVSCIIFVSISWSLQGPKAPWVHTDEGDDDMPAHVKSSMFGSSLTIPITNGRLNLGMWQVRFTRGAGLYLYLFIYTDAVTRVS